MIENWRTSRSEEARRESRVRREALWRRPPVRMLAAVLAILLVGVLAIVATLPRHRYATAHYTNRDAGYSFLYPPTWTLDEEGTTAKLTGLGRQVVITFGLGGVGDLRTAFDRLVGTIRASYTGVELTAEQRQLVQGNASLAVGGAATNPSGTRIRFFAVAIRGGNANYAIVVFAGAGADPTRILPPAQEIVASFHPPVS